MIRGKAIPAAGANKNTRPLRQHPSRAHAPARCHYVCTEGSPNETRVVAAVTNSARFHYFDIELFQTPPALGGSFPHRPDSFSLATTVDAADRPRLSADHPPGRSARPAANLRERPALHRHRRALRAPRPAGTIRSREHAGRPPSPGDRPPPVSA